MTPSIPDTNSVNEITPLGYVLLKVHQFLRCLDLLLIAGDRWQAPLVVRGRAHPFLTSERRIPSPQVEVHTRSPSHREQSEYKNLDITFQRTEDYEEVHVKPSTSRDCEHASAHPQ